MVSHLMFEKEDAPWSTQICPQGVMALVYLASFTRASAPPPEQKKGRSVGKGLKEKLREKSPQQKPRQREVAISRE